MPLPPLRPSQRALPGHELLPFGYLYCSCNLNFIRIIPLWGFSAQKAPQNNETLRVRSIEATSVSPLFENCRQDHGSASEDLNKKTRSIAMATATHPHGNTHIKEPNICNIYYTCLCRTWCILAQGIAKLTIKRPRRARIQG